MMDMSKFAQQQRIKMRESRAHLHAHLQQHPIDILNGARKISEIGSKLEKLARELVDQCRFSMFISVHR